MKKKWCMGIAGFIFAFVTMFSAFAALEGEAVLVRNFQYTNEEGTSINSLVGMEDKKVFANFDLIGNSDSTDYVAAMMYYDAGKLVDMDVTSGSVNSGETADPSIQLSVSLSSELVNPEIVTVVWDSLENMKPLTSPAWFGSSDSSLYTLSINNQPLPLSDGLFQYSKLLIAGKEKLDYSYQAIPRDLTAAVSAIKDNGTLKVSVNSHDATSQQEYSVETSITIPDIAVEKYAHEQCYLRNQHWGSVNALVSLDGSPASTDLRSQWRGYAGVGSSYRAFIQFDIPDVFDVCEIESAVLHMYVKSDKLPDEEIEVAAHKAPANWYENVEASLNSLPSSMPTMGIAKPVTVDDGEGGTKYVEARGYKKVELPLDLSKMSAGKLSLMITQNYALYVAESGIDWTKETWVKDDTLFINTKNATDEEGNCMMPYITLNRKEK